jgi:hypothetical protein
MGAPRLRSGRGQVPCTGGVAVCAERVCAHQTSVGRGRRLGWSLDGGSRPGVYVAVITFVSVE